jgi:uncharacterized membrane protein
MTPAKDRLTSIDALRGLIMIVMALDHVRDFTHRGAMLFNPADLSRTNVFLFFTRWITHFCAPVFVFTAGMGAYFWWSHGRTRPQLSRFLATRGLWLILLELIVMRFAYYFNLASRYPVLLLVLWMIGLGMIGLAALVWLPMPVLAVLSVAGILAHNAFDRVTGGPLVTVLHRPGAIPLAGFTFLTPYPLIPWVFVMAAGFCFARGFRRLSLPVGVAATVAFVALRAANVYGDPVLWSAQKSSVFTLLSFLNCTKYPPSLLFLLMTLGPALILLAWFDRRNLSPSNPLVIYGRVPLLYFIAHFLLAHLAGTLLMLARYGAAALPLIGRPFPSMLGPDPAFPADFGWPLWVTYAVWVSVVLILYPLCRWYANLKATRKSWWLSYL